MLKLIKNVKIKGDKRYTNYLLELEINGTFYRVAIEPKHFGREWTHPSVRQSYTLLDLIAVKECD